MTYKFLDFEISVPTREILRGPDVVAVEGQVFDLLVYLIEHRDRLVTKDELFEEVWKKRFVSDAALTTRIRDLRAALGDSGKQQAVIKTIHGRGFRFIPDVKANPSQQVSLSTNKAHLSQDVRFLQSYDSTRIAYSEMGDGGVPIVKTANWMSHLEYDFESPVWRHWIEALAGMARLIRYDERGNGMSEWELDEVTHEDCVRDLECLLATLGLERINLFGISQGASVAIDFAVRHPEKVHKIVIYGGFARGWRFSEDPAQIGQRIAMSMLMENGWGQESHEFRQLFTSRFMPSATPELADWLNELQRKSVAPKMAAKLHNMFGTIDVMDKLDLVKAPTLVLHARHDREIPLENGRAIAEGISGATFRSLDSDNHILLENEPAFQELKTAAARFLAD